VAFEARPSNWTSTGREFPNSAYKLLVVDLVDWMQSAVSLEGNCVRLKKKTRSKMSTYPNLLHLACRVIFRISIRARNFCSSLNCLKYGSRGNKRHFSSSTSVSSIFSAAKSAVVIPRRKFRFASFFLTFRGRFFSSSCELFASSSFRLFNP